MQRRQVVITPGDADHVKEKNGRPKVAWRLPDGFATLRDGLWQLMVVGRYVADVDFALS